MLMLILTIIFAIIMGFLKSYFFVLIYVKKLQKYFIKKKKQSNLIKLFSFLFQLSIPIFFISIGFLLPFEIIKFFSHKYLISEDILKKLLSYYAFVFLFSFFGFLLLFIKQGKIKVTFSR
jgi:hypothetical protein